MVLFLDRLPFLALSRVGPVHDWAWGVPLPVVATEDDRTAPLQPTRFYPWLLDTAYTGRAHVWRSDLPLLGLDPRRPTRPQQAATQSAYGLPIVNQERAAALWLFGNVPPFLDRPFLLPLGNRLEVHVPAAPNVRRGGLGLPLIGNRLLMLAGLRADIDYGRRRLSAWVPATWAESCLQYPRRLLGGWARHDTEWYTTT